MVEWNEAIGRRSAVIGGGLLAGVVSAQAETTQAGFTSMEPEIPIAPPRTEFVYEAVFELEPSMSLGEGPLGERRMVPITGGRFAGPLLHGRVLPGGADRQLVRRDGVRQLNALYELETHDGAVITVNNRVLIADQQGGGRYAFSTLDITAPDGPYGWLNRGVFVGTLDSLQPRHEVLIRVFRVV
jgi:hypothetical protein